MPRTTLEALINAALQEFGVDEPTNYKVEIPSRSEQGDYATNAAIVNAKKLSLPPLQLAEKLADFLRQKSPPEMLSRIEVAKPGFINFFLSDNWLLETAAAIPPLAEEWGKALPKNKLPILLEFVSANPTGPLHVGHGRWAVIGDIIANLLVAAGEKVTKEFYVNNVGNQVEKLFLSVLAARRNEAPPEGGYGGAYIREVQGESKGEMLSFLLRGQQEVLARLAVKFDNYYLESDLHGAELVKKAVASLTAAGKTYQEKGALWFRSTDLGDDKDRVLIREDGNPTYFAADIAYHLHKFERGFGHLIDIWGTDHHGYVGRLKGALQALGLPPEKLEIIIGQLVTLYRGDEPIRMSKRTGEMITLEEVVEEIGSDAVRFFFAGTDVNSHLDFDLELAKKRSNDNPVYYVQYAHARICGIVRKAAEEGGGTEDRAPLDPAERALLLKIAAFPQLVQTAARLRHPHRLTEYAKELATAFHYFYEKCRVIGNKRRLLFADAARITLKNVLKLLGISAPESM